MILFSCPPPEPQLPDLSGTWLAKNFNLGEDVSANVLISFTGNNFELLLFSPEESEDELTDCIVLIGTRGAYNQAKDSINCVLTEIYIQNLRNGKMQMSRRKI